MLLPHRMRLLAVTTGSAALIVSLVPGTAWARLDYQVQPGDTLSQVAARLGVSSRSIIDANDLDDPNHIVAGSVLVIPDAVGGPSAHTVQEGDTLAAIAAHYGISAHALAEANGLDNPNLIRIGATLSLEGVAESAPGGAARDNDAVAAGDDEVRRLITQAAANHGWRPSVPLGLAMQESGWNNTVVSSSGARGIMQVLPATGEWVGTYLLRRDLDLGVPADNVAAGMAYLDYLYGRFDNDVRLALAAYFEGPRHVETNGPTDAADRYVANVLALAERYR